MRIAHELRVTPGEFAQVAAVRAAGDATNDEHLAAAFLKEIVDRFDGPVD